MKIDLRLVTIDQHIKDGSTNSNDRSWGIDAVWIGLSPKLLDLETSLPPDEVEEMARGTGEIVNLEGCLRSNDHLRTLGQTEHDPTIPAGNDHIPREELILCFDSDRDRKRNTVQD